MPGEFLWALWSLRTRARYYDRGAPPSLAPPNTNNTLYFAKANLFVIPGATHVTR